MNLQFTSEERILKRKFNNQIQIYESNNQILLYKSSSWFALNCAYKHHIKKLARKVGQKYVMIQSAHWAGDALLHTVG